jgi:membrane protease YdiL (CAAX protease family)
MSSAANESVGGRGYGAGMSDIVSPATYKVRTLGAVVFLFVTILIFYRIFPTRHLLPQYGAGQIITYSLQIAAMLWLTRLFKLPTSRFFSRPRLSAVSVSAILIALVISNRIRFSWLRELSVLHIVTGIILVAMIGITEELESRIIVIGLLERFGIRFAIVASSVIFGLIHLNLYIGSNWELWNAYNHVVSAGAGGLFFAALMYATRSVYIPMFFHAAWDWTIPFRPEPSSAEIAALDTVQVSLFENIYLPWSGALIEIIPTLILLYLTFRKKKEAPVTKSEASSVMQVM